MKTETRTLHDWFVDAPYYGITEVPDEGVAFFWDTAEVWAVTLESWQAVKDSELALDVEDPQLYGEIVGEIMARTVALDRDDPRVLRAGERVGLTATS